MSRPRVKCHVFVDFDGTIASLDTTDFLLERFAAPRWRQIEDDWKAGLIGSRECLVRQIDLVRATPAQLDDFIEHIEIDPGFPAFVALCCEQGHEVTVVSDGLDRAVEAVLKRHDLELSFYANHLEWRGQDRWRLRFPYARSDCEALSGNCKCQFTEEARLDLRMVIGDGRSDFSHRPPRRFGVGQERAAAALRRQRAARSRVRELRGGPSYLGGLARWPTTPLLPLPSCSGADD